MSNGRSTSGRRTRIMAVALVGFAAGYATAAWAADSAPRAGATGSAAPSSAATPPADIATEKWALLNKYCGKCHNTTDWAGGVAFDALSPESIPQDAETWEKAVRKLRGGLMPPAGNPRPDNKAVRSFVSWMEGNLDRAADAHA